ncbi:MAG: hypothetical protein GXY17_10380 [Clostridiaceae bacterium]|jgi:uncharacterized membrane protein YkvI|nr:hypothetical protein [Clostridiaceae bacterium]
MTEELKNIVKVACIYATSIIGAGFASGQEIMQFFSNYSNGGFYGIMLAGFMFAVLGSIVLRKIHTERIRNYEEFLYPTFGWRVGWVINVSVTVFMLCMFCVMLAGSGNVLSDWLGLPYVYAALIMGLICLGLIMTNIRGIVTLSTFITPLLVGGIIIAGVAVFFFSNTQVFLASEQLRFVSRNWIVSSLLYVSYNSIPAIVMMCGLLPYLKTRRTATVGGLAGGMILCLTALIIHTVICSLYPVAMDKELPMLAILSSFSSSAGSLYSIVLWLAMLVSAVTTGFCFADRISASVKLDRRVAVMLTCLAAVPLSTLGFSRLISLIYPIFGYLGLFMIIVLLVQKIAQLQHWRRSDT